MKLLSKYSRINLLTTVTIFLFASTAFYFLLRFVLEKQLDNDLSIERHEIEMHVARTGNLPEVFPLKDQLIRFERSGTGGEPFFSTKNIVYPGETNATEYRVLIFFVRDRESMYRVAVLKSFSATNRITRSVIAISVITVILMLIANFVVNRIVLKELWRPFYNSLDKMKRYRPGRENIPELENSNIEEFNAMNDSLGETIHQAEKEYRLLKEFNENASHEMQTPLAVLRAKLDVLIQDEQLSEKQGGILQGTYDAVQRLVRLNQSMLLLNKIENNQFAEKTTVDLKKLVESKTGFFKELTENKNLEVRVRLSKASLSINALLADVLLNNLFSNAVRHTPRGGYIDIELTAARLTIANGKSHLPLDDKKIFSRFYKAGVESDEHGLGLAIVHQICIESGLTIGYSHEGDEHRFGVFFSGA